MGYHAVDPDPAVNPLKWERTDAGYRSGKYTITRATCVNTPTRVRFELKYDGRPTPCYEHRHLWAAKECAEAHRRERR